MRTTIRVLTNIPDLPAKSRSGLTFEHTYVSADSKSAGDQAMLMARNGAYDVTLLEMPPPATLRRACLSRALSRKKRSKLVLVDVVLPAPETFKQRLMATAYKWLLKQVDLFVLFIHDTRGLQRYYGLRPRQFRYIPFKVNGIEQIPALQGREGTYIWSGGRSQRDYPTLLQALRGLSYPTQILTILHAERQLHGTRLTDQELPPHVSLVNDDGSFASWLQSIADAKFVVLPIRREAISPAGVSAFLVAMALGKCVIVSDCPATRGVLQDNVNAVIVPADDPNSLREAIRRVWEDDAWREQIAAAGKEYALSLGGEETLRRNIVEATADFLEQDQPQSADGKLADE